MFGEIYGMMQQGRGYELHNLIKNEAKDLMEMTIISALLDITALSNHISPY